jgi:hypothetical protein
MEVMERRTRISDVLRKAKAEAVDNDMLARLQRERRLQAIDRQLQELAEMRQQTTHPKLLHMLDSKLTQINAAREAIA